MTQATTWGVPRSADAPVTPAIMADRMDDSLDALLSTHRGATRPSYAVNGTIWQDSDNNQVFLFDGASGDTQFAINVGVPASAAATGNQGDMAWDADYIYVCTATDTWKRVAITTW